MKQAHKLLKEITRLKPLPNDLLIKLFKGLPPAIDFAVLNTKMDW